MRIKAKILWKGFKILICIDFRAIIYVWEMPCLKCLSKDKGEIYESFKYH